jgi:hypothetical protein
MIVLENLSAMRSELAYHEARGILQTVHEEPVPGFFRRATIGPAGVVLSSGDAEVAIPLAELFRVAAVHEPRLNPPA